MISNVKLAYKKKILGFFTLSFLVLLGIIYFVIAKESQYCQTIIDCIRISIYGAPYQYLFLPISALILSLIPLFFLKESVYIAWRKFAIVALPIIALLILMTPAHAPGAYVSLGIDREYVSIACGILFLLTSWLLIAIKAVKTR